MKLRWLIAFTIILGLSGAHPAHASDTWALLVGVTKYQKKVNPLSYPAADAASLRDVLIDPHLGGVPASHVLLLTDDQATRANIYDGVDGFLKGHVKSGDQVLVFLAGHGVAKGTGDNAKGFFLPTDIRGLATPALIATAVDLRVLSLKLGALPAAQFVLFVDACRDDPTPGRGLKGNPLQDSMRQAAQVVPEDKQASSATFFSCSEGECANETDEFKHGVFTYYILDAIEHGPVAKAPDGSVDLGVLASYVKARVVEWAAKETALGDDEFHQTPECVMPRSNATSIIVLRVQRPLTAEAVSADAPTLVVNAPQGARVAIDGQDKGTGAVAATLPHQRSCSVQVQGPGCAPVNQSVSLVGGVEQTMTVGMQPSAGATSPGPWLQQAQNLYRKALLLEQQQQYDAAAAGYNATLQQDAQFAPAYERLASIQALQSDPKAAIDTLIRYSATMPGAHSFALLSRQYFAYALVLADPAAPDRKFTCPSVYGVPSRAGQAAAFCKQAALDAVIRDPRSSESQLALGFAAIATDINGENRSSTLEAFRRALSFSNNSADCLYACGYAHRFFGEKNSNPQARTAELDDAIGALISAVHLRPNFYEAHRELAYCYHLLDQPRPALKEYQMAGAYGNQATDPNEVAGANVAVAELHLEIAGTLSGAKKQVEEAAAQGYLADAEEITPHLDSAVGALVHAGLGPHLGNLRTELPSSKYVGYLGASSHERGITQVAVPSPEPVRPRRPAAPPSARPVEAPIQHHETEAERPKPIAHPAPAPVPHHEAVTEHPKPIAHPAPAPVPHHEAVTEHPKPISHPAPAPVPHHEAVTEHPKPIAHPTPASVPHHEKPVAPHHPATTHTRPAAPGHTASAHHHSVPAKPKVNSGGHAKHSRWKSPFGSATGIGGKLSAQGNSHSGLGSLFRNPKSITNGPGNGNKAREPSPKATVSPRSGSG